MQAKRSQKGFTLLEVMVALAIMGILAAISVPNLLEWLENQRLRDAARRMADALLIARSEAIRSGNNYIVFFSTLGGTDPAGTALTDVNGTPVPVLILDDGLPAASNCRIDAGEDTYTVSAETGVNWGVTFAGSEAPNEPAGVPFGTGSTFTDRNNAAVNWVLFGPDGIPLSFTAACVVGSVGSAQGALYLTNGDRDMAVVLHPLGGVSFHAWEAGVGQWTN